MEAAAALARLLQFLGVALLFGRHAFLQGARPTGAFMGTLLVAAGALVALACQTAVMIGSPAAALRGEELWLVLSGTAYGHGVALRVALALAFGALLTFKAPRPLLLAAGAAVAASLALTGHAAAGEGASGLLHQIGDAAHAVAAAAWLGALLAFAQSTFDAESRPAETAGALARFAGAGGLIVAVLLATGVLNGWMLVGPGGAGLLFASAYGGVLLAKMALFAAMVGLAATNRFILTPALTAALPRDPAPALAKLKLSLALETAAGLVVLALAAVLGLLPPPAEIAAAP